MKKKSHLRGLSAELNREKQTSHTVWWKGEKGRQWGRQTVSKWERGRERDWKKAGRWTDKERERERVVEKRTVIGAMCLCLSLPLSSSLTHPANPLCVFHHPVCPSVCLPSITASQLLCEFDSRQKWLASQHTGHDLARLRVRATPAGCELMDPFWTGNTRTSLLSAKKKNKHPLCTHKAWK